MIGIMNKDVLSVIYERNYYVNTSKRIVSSVKHSIKK